MPLINVVADMEDNGIKLDLDYLHQLSEKYNLDVDVVTFYKNNINNSIHETKDLNSAFIVINNKLVSDINSNMKDTDILRKIYEMVSSIIKK